MHLASRQGTSSAAQIGSKAMSGNLGSSFTAAVSVLLWGVAARGEAPIAQPACLGQDVSDRQSNGAFNSIVDGQPPSPDQPQVAVAASYDRAAHAALAFVSFGITPEIGGKFCQTQLGVTLPAYDIGKGRIVDPGVIGLSWEQRWRLADGNGPTLSTNVAWDIPLKSGGGGVSMSMTGIAAQNTKHGVLYLNATLQSGPDFAWSTSTWSTLLGYKHIVREGLEVYADVMYAAGDLATVEMSAEIDLLDGWSVGPGLAVSTDLSGRAAGDLVLGVALSRGF